MVWEIDGLTFASIRGAGHMVPTDKPEEALVMLDNFINDQEFKSPDDYM
jgi:serine carboxypeptidase-like clade 2